MSWQKGNRCLLGWPRSFWPTAVFWVNRGLFGQWSVWSMFFFGQPRSFGSNRGLLGQTAVFWVTRCLFGQPRSFWTAEVFWVSRGFWVNGQFGRTWSFWSTAFFLVKPWFFGSNRGLLGQPRSFGSATVFWVSRGLLGQVPTIVQFIQMTERRPLSSWYRWPSAGHCPVYTDDRAPAIVPFAHGDGVNKPYNLQCTMAPIGYSLIGTWPTIICDVIIGSNIYCTIMFREKNSFFKWPKCDPGCKL